MPPPPHPDECRRLSHRARGPVINLEHLYDSLRSRREVLVGSLQPGHPALPLPAPLPAVSNRCSCVWVLFMPLLRSNKLPPKASGFHPVLQQREQRAVRASDRFWLHALPRAGSNKPASLPTDVCLIWTLKLPVTCGFTGWAVKGGIKGLWLNHPNC